MTRRRNPQNVLPLRPKPLLMLLVLQQKGIASRLRIKKALHEWESAVPLLALAFLMATVAVLAALGPARRGLEIQPTDALRSDG